MQGAKSICKTNQLKIVVGKKTLLLLRCQTIYICHFKLNFYQTFAPGTVVNPLTSPRHCVNCLAPGAKGLIFYNMPNNSHELIPISKRDNQEQWVDARTLHRFLEVGKDFSTWIKDFIADFDFVEGRDFSPNLGKSTGGRQAIEYSLTVDMAKELSMLQRSEKGKQARQYFIACEKELRHLQQQLLGSYWAIEQLLQSSPQQVINDSIWYPVNPLRLLAGKSAMRSHKIRAHAQLQPHCFAKMPYKGWEAWWVRQDAVPVALAVKDATLKSAAIVKLLQTQGGTHA
jgi:phage anti-repressor protein